VTLTIPALEAGAHVVFLAVGEEKAAAARRAFADEPSRLTPASLVRSRHGTTTVILDEAAAALLD
jgi:6-phosphogluconolactonase/glucosamine-6-phosphate isomerase/deaminase